MANNLVVQLLLKTGTFSTDLKQAKGQIQNFQKGCDTAGKSVSAFSNALGINVGALTKLGGAIGAAALAGKELKAIIESTHTSADTFQSIMSGCTGVLDSFNSAIARADFSSFQNGLWGVWEAARNAANALNDLQDAQLGYGMLSSKNRREFTEAQTLYKEYDTAAKAAKTKEERETFEAKREEQRLKMEAAVSKAENDAYNFKYKNFNHIRTSIASENPNINPKNVTYDMIYEVADIFNSLDSDKRKKEAKEAADAVKKTAKTYKGSGSRLNGTYSNPKRDQYYEQHQRELIIYALLEMNKEDIEKVKNEIESGEGASESATQMRRLYDRTIRPEIMSGVVKAPKVSSTTTKNDEAEKHSLNWWKAEQSKYEKMRGDIDKEVHPVAWEEADKKAKEAAAEVKKIEDSMKSVTPLLEGSSAYYTKMKNDALELQKNVEVFSDDWYKQEKIIQDVDKELRNIDLARALMIDPPTIDSLQTILTLVTQIRNECAIGSEQFEMWSDVIKRVKEELDKANGVKPELQAPDTSQWEKFNQAMANTSTIVSSVSNTFKEGAEMTAASVLQMVATCLPAIGNLIAALDALTVTEAVEAGTAAVGKAVSTSQHWVEAIAAVASLSAVVAAAIAAASRPKTQKFATGGIVGGNSFYGDRVSAQVNSGEMILNRSQQARLFQMANSGGMGGQVEFHISGTELVGVLNNQNRKNNLIR